MEYNGYRSIKEYESECARIGYTTRRVPFRKGDEKYFALITAPPGHPTGTSVQCWTLFTADEKAQVLQGITVSSTYIRQLLQAGDMPTAEAFLGHPHILTDTVRHGHALGRRMSAPTVNMRVPAGVLVPRHGVYATRVRLPEGSFPAVTNIGVRPTVSQDEALTVETHLLDFDGDLYDRTLVLEFYEHLRDEIKFSSMEELSAQIAADGARARKILEGHP